jgi:ribosomal protein S18 acetylase RimI-like enzyme
MAEPLVRMPVRGEVRDAADVLVDALADDPAWSHVLPDPATRRRALGSLVAVALADAGGHARVAVEGRRVVGAAVWQPPGRYPMTPARQARALPRMARFLATTPRAARRIRRLGDALDAVFPSEPVRYLQILGVAPDAQGRGVGSALLRRGLEAADVGGEVVYLETGKEANVGLYQRHGFVLVAPGAPVYDGGPVMWRMRRAPDGSAAASPTERPPASGAVPDGRS